MRPTERQEAFSDNTEKPSKEPTALEYRKYKTYEYIEDQDIARSRRKDGDEGKELFITLIY